MSSKSKVCFFFERNNFHLGERTRLKKFIEGIFKKEGIPMNSLNYVFCSDKRLLEINRKFLNHNYYTDIISFDLALKTGVEGEVYISTDRVRKNASTLGLPFKSEIHRVIFHGVLHLCGYKDQTKKDQLQMRQEEDRLLNLYF